MAVCAGHRCLKQKARRSLHVQAYSIAASAADVGMMPARFANLGTHEAETIPAQALARTNTKYEYQCGPNLLQASLAITMRVAVTESSKSSQASNQSPWSAGQTPSVSMSTDESKRKEILALLRYNQRHNKAFCSSGQAHVATAHKRLVPAHTLPAANPPK